MYPRRDIQHAELPRPETCCGKGFAAVPQILFFVNAVQQCEIAAKFSDEFLQLNGTRARSAQGPLVLFDVGGSVENRVA